MRNLRQAIASSALARACTKRGRACQTRLTTTVRAIARFSLNQSLLRCVYTSSPYQRTLQHRCLFYTPLLTPSRPSLYHSNNPANSCEPTPPNKNAFTPRRKFASTRRRCSSTSAVCLLYTHQPLLQERGSHWEHSS